MTNKEIAMKAMQELFVKRNQTAIDQYWTEPYIQHNPNMINGLEGIRTALPYIPENFTYEPGIVIAEGNLVAAHSRVIGWGPVPQIIVDIFRIENGKIIEHWDVIQEEVEASASKNGNPMTSYNISKFNMKSLTLPGNKFLASVHPLAIELSFGLDNTVTFIVTKGAGLVPDGHSETLPVNPIEVRKNIFFLGWTEKSGATVTHLEDYNRETLYTHITMPDGTFMVIPGKLKPLTTPSVLTDVPIINDKLIGKTIKQRFDDLSLTVTFKENNSADIEPGYGSLLGKSPQTVSALVTPISGDSFLVSWQDVNKTTVVQFVDLQKNQILCNVTTKGGALIQKNGVIN